MACGAIGEVGEWLEAVMLMFRSSSCFPRPCLHIHNSSYRLHLDHCYYRSVEHAGISYCISDLDLVLLYLLS